MHLEDVSVLLVPLERVNSARNSRMETVLDVVVHSKVCFDQVREVFDDLVLVFVEKSLQF